MRVPVFLLLLLPVFTMAQPKATFDSKLFFAPGTGLYIENHFDFWGESLRYRTVHDSIIQAEVICTVILKSGENIVNYSRNNITSPLTTAGQIGDFMHIQRLQVNPGKYLLHLELRDAQDTTQITQFNEELDIPDRGNSAWISGILFVAGTGDPIQGSVFNRNGYSMFPYISRKFPEQVSKLKFYTEIYNSDKTFGQDSAFVIITKITDALTADVFGEMQQYQKKKGTAVIPVMGSFDISTLPTGRFLLEFELRDRQNRVVTSASREFFRINADAPPNPAAEVSKVLEFSFVREFTNSDTLHAHIASLRPIASESEKRAIDNQKTSLPSLEAKQMFFYQFWFSRDPDKPEAAWYNYQRELKLAHVLFGTRIRQGYMTDRGRVYLQYGPPNTRTEQPSEPASYPYEIWHYYHIDKYTNRKFVFYNSDLVTNEYELLHSDMFGEPKNPNWQRYLSRRNNPMDNPDLSKPDSQYGNRADELFQNPR